MADNAASGAVGGAAKGAAVGSVVPGVGTAIGAAVGGLLGGVGGWLGGNSQKKANEEAYRIRRKAIDLLDPWSPAFTGAFSGLQNLAAPTLNAIMAGQGMAGQQAAYGLQAGLGRAGLGSTGLGASLGAGAMAGAAFQGNQLRARLLQDLLSQTQNIQATQAGILGGTPTQPVTQNAFTGALGGAGGALQILGALYNQGNQGGN